MGDVKVADTLRVIRRAGDRAARLEIDGEMFDLATVDGFTVHPVRGKLPCVTLSICAWRVEVIDDAKSETLREVSA